MSEKEHIHEEHTECSALLSSLGEYVDGELSPELCELIEQHMQGCNRCQVVVNTLKKTIELYQETSDDPTLPEDVRRRLFMKLNIEDYLK